ncbi:unnamed protein product, partial [Brenthis ino]
MIQFEKCCFYIPRKTGCLIIGYLNLIGSIIGLLFSIYGIVLGDQATRSSKPKHVDVAYMIIGSAVVLALIFLLAFAFCIVLLVGINKNKPGHVKAYLKYNLIFLTIHAVLLLLSIQIDALLLLVLFIYFFLVINSYYTKMQEEKATKEIQKV